MVVLAVLPLRLHTLSYVGFYALWCLLLPLWHEKATQGKIQRCSSVLIRTGLGTRAVLLGSVLAVTGLWNFSCAKLGTMKNLQVLLVLAL